MYDPQLKSLLDHIGIGQSGTDHATLMELMSFTLQCLGGVRMMVAQATKEKKAKLAAADLPRAHKSDDTTGDDAVVIAFSIAMKQMMSAVSSGMDVDDLDPSRHLVESFPQEAAFGRGDWLPLHWAVLGEANMPCGKCYAFKNGTSSSSFVDTNEVDRRIRVVKALMTTYPSMANQLDKEGRSILHYAARQNSEALVDCVIQHTSPDGFGPDVANANGAFPLHNVARFSKSTAVAATMLQNSPHIITVGNNDGTLPLHWAAAKNTNLGILEILIKAHPDAIKIANHEGYLPLHSAGQNNQLHIVQAIYKANPAAISVRDSEGGVPLHHASCFNSNLEVVKFLYSSYREGVTVVQEDGITPLHLAASQNPSANVMKFLLHVYPTAVHSTDSQGWMPLHCLLNKHRDDMTASRIDCLRLLLAANPMAVIAVRNDGVSALDMARLGEHRDFIMRLLLLAHPPADPVTLATLNWESYRGRAVKACLLYHRAISGRVVFAGESTLQYVVRRLLEGSVGMGGISIKNCVLQYILKFL